MPSPWKSGHCLKRTKHDHEPDLPETPPPPKKQLSVAEKLKLYMERRKADPERYAAYV